MAGSDELGNSPPTSEYVKKSDFDEFRKTILELLRVALPPHGECSSPPAPVLASPSPMEAEQAHRQGKELATGEGSGLQARVLFNSSPRTGYPSGEVERTPSTRQGGGGSPFCELIISAPVPDGFSEPDMSYYAGKDDPIQHLQWFEDMTSIRQMSDAFKCRLFAVTFRGKARDWFHQLPGGTIYSFEDLRRIFLLRFSTSKKRRKGAEALFVIRQRSGETLGSYVDRFQEEVLQVVEVPGHTLQLAFTLGLQQGLFRMSLTRDPPVSFEELMERAAREIECEATNQEFMARLAKSSEEEKKEDKKEHGGRRREEVRSQGYQGPPAGSEQGWRSQPPAARPAWRSPGGPSQGQGRGHFHGGGGHHGRHGRFNPAGWQPDARPLQAQPLQAMAIGRKKGWKKRNRLGNGAGESAPLYCDFHQQEGHATATCPEFLEMRGRGGAPAGGKQLCLEGPSGKGKGKKEEDDPCEERTDQGALGGICVIHGGAGIEATRKGSLHTIYRRSIASTSRSPPPGEKITFSALDMPTHEDPFCDALVIKAAIENFTVSRILVDNGSSVNVVFKKAFDKMKVEGKRVLASDGPLFGFSGERKEVEGGVELLVTLGGTSKNCRFVIVDAPSSYNAIFGRPLISAYQCVPSSYHQCLKYNTGGVQVRVRGDPREARQCYVTAVNTIEWAKKAEEMEEMMKERAREYVAEWAQGGAM